MDPRASILAQVRGRFSSFGLAPGSEIQKLRLDVSVCERERERERERANFRTLSTLFRPLVVILYALIAASVLHPGGRALEIAQYAELI